MPINKLFDLLDDWRTLPAYQLERRADIFFAIHLEKIIEKQLKTRVSHIIPEFPLRVGEVSKTHPNSNKSFKIDYLAYAKESETVFLIELKTDQSSRREGQDEYLKGAKEIKVHGLIDGILKIYQATDQKLKYDSLIDKLVKMGWIARNEKKLINTSPDIEPVVVYIQPRDESEKIISFDDVIDSISDSDEPLTQRFVQSLELWKHDVNETG